MIYPFLLPRLGGVYGSINSKPVMVDRQIDTRAGRMYHASAPPGVVRGIQRLGDCAGTDAHGAV